MSNLELARSFYDDETNLLGSLHPDVEWHEMEGFPYGGVYRGIPALMKGVFEHLPQDWDEFAATPHTLLPSGDDVVTLGHYSGVSRKTGRPMRAAFAHVYTFEKGKVVRFRQYADSTLVNAALA